MCLERLESYIGIAANIAAVGTLVFLAFEVRKNTKAISMASRRGATDQGLQTQAVIGQSKEAASVFRRGLSESEVLDEDEEVQFTIILSMVITTADNTYNDYVHDALTDGVLESAMRPAKLALNTKAGQTFWRNHSAAFTPEFREYIENFLNRPMPNDAF